MQTTVTDRDMRDFVTRSLGGAADGFDIPAIVDHLQAVVGTVDLRLVERDAYWRIVHQHEHPHAFVDPTPHMGLIVCGDCLQTRTGGQHR